MTDTRQPDGVVAGQLQPVESPALFRERLAVRQIGQWSLVWHRFKRHRLAVIGAWVALFVVLLAIVGPFIAPPLPKLDAYGELPLWAQRIENMPPRLDWPYLLGADGGGAPTVSDVLLGGRPILGIGIFGALLASILGITIGGFAGYLGSYVDAFLMRLVDAFLAVPFLILLILLTRYLPFEHTIPVYIVIFGLAGWAGVARLVRSYILSLREREYTVAARALGVSPGGIILRHLLPNALDVLVVSFTLNAAVFMVTDVTLDFLGAGTGILSWGTWLNMLSTPYWWEGAFPGVALLLTVLAVNFLGDGLRDALDTSSPTAIVTLERPGEPGLARHLVSSLTQTVGSARDAVRATIAGLELQRWREAAVARAVPAGVRDWTQAEGRRGAARTSLLLGLGPIVLVFLAGGIVMLLGHSPLNYAPNYPSPTTFAGAYSEQEYGAWPHHGGWDLFQVDTAARLVFQRIDGQGHLVRTQTVAPGSTSTSPSLAEDGRHILGAWVAGSGQLIRVAYLNRPHLRPIALNPPGGIAEHPFVVAMPGGRLGVLFNWQRPGQSTFDIYLATFSDASAPHLRRLIHSGDYGLYPRAITDGSGHLDVVYLQRHDQSHGVWQVRFSCFTPSGAPLGRPQVLGTVSYLVALPGGGYSSEITPTQWAIDLKRARDGSVWAAWEIGDDVVSGGQVSGSNALSVGHWNRDGRQMLPPAVVVPAVDAGAQSVALALHHGGGILYYPSPGQIESILTGTTFGREGQAIQSVRVAYDTGGRPSNPRAGTIAGRPAVIWQKVRGGTVTLEETRYRPAAPPDLLTRLGLNVGGLCGNLLLVIFGALAGGIALTIINVYLLAPLLLVWLVLRRVGSARLRWPLYLAAIAVLLAWIFAASPNPPGYVLMIAAFGFPYAWLAVAGGIFTSWWSSEFILKRQEAGVRAMVMALLGLYFIAVMYAVIFIEGQIGQS